MNTSVIIIHGAYGHPEENWFGWLRRQLEEMNIECIAPAFPTPAGQTLDNWLQLMKRDYSRHIRADTIMIGHSLGAAFVLRWLEQTKYPIKAALLAGAFTGEVGISTFDDINRDFFAQPFEWDVIKQKCTQFTCYHGDNDPYVRRENMDYIADSLGASKVIISNGGHLNAAAGYTHFPLLLQHLKDIS